jgi:hypothetical protein
MEPGVRIAVQIQKTDSEFAERLTKLQGVETTVLETSSFDGHSEIISIILTLTPVIATLVGKIVTEQIRSRRYIKIVCGGVQVQGLSEKNAESVLLALAEKGAAKKKATKKTVTKR